MKKLLLVSCLLNSTMYAAEALGDMREDIVSCKDLIGVVHQLAATVNRHEHVLYSHEVQLDRIPHNSTLEGIEGKFVALSKELEDLKALYRGSTREVAALKQEVTRLKRLVQSSSNLANQTSPESQEPASGNSSRSSSRAAARSPRIDPEDFHPMLRPYVDFDRPIHDQADKLFRCADALIKLGMLDPMELTSLSGSRVVAGSSSKQRTLSAPVLGAGLGRRNIVSPQSFTRHSLATVSEEAIHPAAVHPSVTLLNEHDLLKEDAAPAPDLQK